MKQIPTKIKILGKDFEIIKDDRSPNGTDQLASASYSTQRIWIHEEKDTHIQEQENALLHEIIELISISCGLDLEHDKIIILDSVLYQILADNKLVFGE